MGPTQISTEGKRVYDFDPEPGAPPPLDATKASFDLVRAPRAFSRLGEGWADWLVELHRVLAADGELVAGLEPQWAYEGLTGNRWDESRIGMSTLEGPDEGELRIFHSEWWLREHWGRCFELISLEPADDRLWAVLRKRRGSCDAAELCRFSDDARELSALAANVADLHAQHAHTVADHRRRLDLQREELNRELVRKAYEVSRAKRESERAIEGMTSSLSWTVTRPLRGIKVLLAMAKRRGG